MLYRITTTGDSHRVADTSPTLRAIGVLPPGSTPIAYPDTTNVRLGAYILDDQPLRLTVGADWDHRLHHDPGPALDARHQRGAGAAGAAGASGAALRAPDPGRHRHSAHHAAAVAREGGARRCDARPGQGHRPDPARHRRLGENDAWGHGAFGSLDDNDDICGYLDYIHESLTDNALLTRRRGGERPTTQQLSTHGDASRYPERPRLGVGGQS